MSRPRRRPSAATIAAQQRAAASRHAATEALRGGATLRLSSRTDIAAGTVHAGTASVLLRCGVASRVPDPDRPGWTLDVITARAR